MKFLITGIIILLVQVSYSQVYFEEDSCCISKFNDQDFSKIDLLELGLEYKRLSKQGDLCCDSTNSDLHQIMIFFGEKFGKEGTTVVEVMKYMGMPDGTEKELYQNCGIELDEDEKALAYLWRSYHDLLYFVYQENTIIRAEWFSWNK